MSGGEDTQEDRTVRLLPAGRCAESQSSALGRSLASGYALRQLDLLLGFGSQASRREVCAAGHKMPLGATRRGGAGTQEDPRTGRTAVPSEETH